ncbi:MAG: MFS transporter [Chloroflexota bacterium]|nr:MFS transporter [Chloroflexota bacterium]
MHTPIESRREVSLWHNRDYVILWSGQTVSSIGSGVSELAFPLLILALTHSPAQAGLAAALRTVPYLIFSLLAGAFVDRWNRKRTMILCDVARALVLGSIPLAFALGLLTIWQLYAVTFIEGTLYVFFSLAETSALPQVVSKTQLPNATAMNNAAYGVTALLGPSLGGILYAVGRTIPFLTDAISYIASAFSLGFIHVRFEEQRARVQRSIRQEIGEGLRWLWRHPLIRYMAFLTAGLRVGNGVFLIAVIVAQRQGASSTEIGLILGVGGVGATLGSLMSPLVQRRFSFGAAISGICWCEALLFLLLVAARMPFTLALVLFVLMLVGPSYDTVQFSYRLALIPDSLQGRVNSVFRMIATTIQPLGLALTGWLLEYAGSATTILMLGGWLVLLAVVTTLNPHVRSALPLDQAVAM